MSNSTVFFGAPPVEGQVISDTLRAKGINLLKLSPSSVKIHGGPSTIQPGFAMYKSYLPAYLRAGITRETVTPNEAYGCLPHSLLKQPFPLLLPDLVITFRYPITEDQRKKLHDLNFNDTVIRGRPALIVRNPQREHVKAAEDLNADPNSPSPENAVNLRDLRKCAIIRGILKSFISVHQYPAFVDEEHESEFRKGFKGEIGTITPNEKDEDFITALTSAQPSVQGNTDTIMEDAEWRDINVHQVRFRVNLPVPAIDQPLFYDVNSVPISAGLLFPYEPQLAKFDKFTVPNVIYQYFFAGLGDTVEDATKEFEEIVASWGNVFNTEFSNVMSHIFKVIEISLRTQTRPILMMTANNYDGVFMQGSAFHITVNGTHYTAVSKEEIERDIKRMDSHASALWSILQQLNLSKEERQGYFEGMESIWDLKDVVDTVSINGGPTVREQMIKNAQFLHFPKDRYAGSYATAIEKALLCIATPTQKIKEVGSLHPPLIFEQDRISLIMGCFGPLAPSFRVPGGKEMRLSSQFKVPCVRGKVGREFEDHREVKKLAVQFVPHEVAVMHMRQVIEQKTILNPFGNIKIVRSASHISKEFEGESFSMLIEGLRKVAQVVVSDEKGKGKREREGESEERYKKKGRMDDGF